MCYQLGLCSCSAFGFKAPASLALFSVNSVSPTRFCSMAEVPALRRRRVGRAGGEGGDEPEQGRRVRARVDDAETRLDTMP